MGNSGIFCVIFGRKRTLSYALWEKVNPFAYFFGRKWTFFGKTCPLSKIVDHFGHFGTIVHRTPLATGLQCLIASDVSFYYTHDASQLSHDASHDTYCDMLHIISAHYPNVLV